MMELMVPALVGAAGNLIAEVGKKGGEWLAEKYQAHNPEVQRRAKINAENYLDRLAKRVERLEKELPTSQNVIDEALNHPGTSLLMQKALISAAATDNELRHTLLSELIAQRLTAESEDMIALVGSAACDVIGSLSSRQIKLLGIMARLFGIRPDQTMKFENSDAYNSFLISWWNTFGLFTDDLDKTNNLDFLHLDGLSCINYSSISENNLEKLLEIEIGTIKYNIDINKFEKLKWWNNFYYAWNVGIINSNLTSIGMLIGILFHDSESKTKTTINWD